MKNVFQKNKRTLEDVKRDKNVKTSL